MHFGEYELSPSLIGLSPLPTGHPEAFQRLLVRSSSVCYHTFSAIRMLPYQMSYDKSKASVLCLMPDYYLRPIARLVSCYALFK